MNNKENLYHWYAHKQTNKQVQAVRFRTGLEDGSVDKKPYVFAIPVGGNGLYENVVVDTTDFIVLSECYSKKEDTMIKYKFIFSEKFFLSAYRRI